MESYFSAPVLRDGSGAQLPTTMRFIDPIRLEKKMPLDSEYFMLIIKTLFLICVFLFGYYFDQKLLKRRDLAILTWLWGLAMLTIMIVFPPTPTRIFIGAAVFIIGIVILVYLYIKMRKSNDEKGKGILS